MDEIVKQILAGDTERFREVVQEFNDEFLRIAFRFTMDWEDARDTTQTTFIRAYRSLRRYKFGHSFRAWIFAVHLNNCRTAWRRSRRRRDRLLPLTEARDAAARNDPSAIESILLRTIQRLSKMQRNAIILIDLNDYSTADAAAVMRCAESTVRVHLARARANLAKHLRALGVRYPEDFE